LWFLCFAFWDLGGRLACLAALSWLWSSCMWELCLISKADESIWHWVFRGVSFHKTPVALSIAPAQDIHPTDWRHAYERELQEEGDSARPVSNGKTYHFDTSALEVPYLSATRSFVLVLTPAPGYTLSGYAFRETSVRSMRPPWHFEEKGALHLFEALRVSKSGDFSPLRIQVPRCEDGDKLHIILRAASNSSPRPGDFTQTFQSSIE
jgi:hypothetical protein